MSCFQCAVWYKMTYNIGMSELPILCPSCNEENMADMENLETRPINKLVSEMGFNCIKCSKWVRVTFMTRLLDTAMNKLASKSPESSGYHFHFAKTLKKAEGVQERYGTL